MADDELVFTLAWADIDPALLHEESRELGTDAFRQAVAAFLQRQYESLGGKARFIFNDADRSLTVHWAKPGSLRSAEEKALEALKRGDASVAIPLLKALIAKDPSDASPLCNLGMLYSDQGKLKQAEELLRLAADLDPSNPHIVVSLGVVHARMGDLNAAVETLQRAVQISPDDPFAHQNLGACLLKQGDAEQAETHFRKSLRRDPENRRSQYGLAQTLETLGRLDDADEVYQTIIRAAGHTPVGEWAKEGRTRIAHAMMRKGGAVRPDVVMYCLGALQRFEDMTDEEVQGIAREIAILGLNGLDINDPDQKYVLKTLPGKFSGLHLLSLMYVAFKRIRPDADVRADFSREYAQAMAMFGGQ